MPLAVIMAALGRFLGVTVVGGVVAWVAAALTKETLVAFWRRAGRVAFAAALVLTVVNLAKPYLTDLWHLVPNEAFWMLYVIGWNDLLNATLGVAMILVAIMILKRQA